MSYKIFPILNLKYQIKVQEENNTEIVIHHHKPSMTLARARQIRSYRIHLDLQVIVKASKVKEEK